MYIYIYIYIQLPSAFPPPCPKCLPGGPQMPPKSALDTTLAPHWLPFEHQKPPHGAPNAFKVVPGHQSGPPLDHPWTPRGKSDRKQWFAGRPFGPILKDVCSRLRVFLEPKSHPGRFLSCNECPCHAANALLLP